MKAYPPVFSPCRRQLGLSLIELMVAITISLILLTGVIQVFLSSKLSYRLLEATSRVQENGRFSIGYLTEEVRMAGYTGCGSYLPPPTNMADVNGDGIPDAAADFTTGAIDGFEYSELPVVLTDAVTLTAADVEPDTDIIVVMSGAPSANFNLVGNMTTVNANIQLSSAAAGEFQADDILLITDCEDSDVFAANNVSEGSGKITIAHSNAVNIGNFLSKTYGPDALVMKLQKTAYYVGPNANGVPTLMRRRLGNGATMSTEELVDNVENMQILYGEDTNGDGIANRYVEANNVGSMDDVVSVRISLLLRTDDNIASAPQTYTYSGAATTAADLRMRRVFNSTIKIRNRGVL